MTTDKRQRPVAGASAHSKTASPDHTAKRFAAVVEKASGIRVVFSAHTSVQECDATVARLRQFGLNATTRLIREPNAAIPGATVRGPR